MKSYTVIQKKIWIFLHQHIHLLSCAISLLIFVSESLLLYCRHTTFEWATSEETTWERNICYGFWCNMLEVALWSWQFTWSWQVCFLLPSLTFLHCLCCAMKPWNPMYLLAPGHKLWTLFYQLYEPSLNINEKITGLIGCREVWILSYPWGI